MSDDSGLHLGPWSRRPSPVLGWTGIRINQRARGRAIAVWASKRGKTYDADLGVREDGYRYARGLECLQTGASEVFRWLRVVGDAICAAVRWRLPRSSSDCAPAGRRGKSDFTSGARPSAASRSDARVMTDD